MNIVFIYFRYTQTLKTWYKRRDHRVRLDELRNKCRHLAQRCLNDSTFITDGYLTRCLAGLEAGSTDAILPPRTNSTSLALSPLDETENMIFDGDGLVKVEYVENSIIECDMQTGIDDESMSQLRSELLGWYNLTIQERRVQAADIFPQAIQIAQTNGMANFSLG